MIFVMLFIFINLFSNFAVFRDYCNVDIRLLNWKFMNFSQILRTNVTVQQIAGIYVLFDFSILLNCYRLYR